MGVASRFSHAHAALSGFCFDIGMPVDAVRGHLIPLGGIKRKLSSRRVLLVGDAAGFVDPFHGEGIAYAVLSGRLAAESLCRVLRNGWEHARAFRWYERQCEQQIRKNLRVALWMARLLDRYPKLFVRIFFDNPRARKIHGHFNRQARIPAFLEMGRLPDALVSAEKLSESAAMDDCGEDRECEERCMTGWTNNSGTWRCS
jgi:flavin-dependent dehydrogenase